MDETARTPAAGNGSSNGSVASTGVASLVLSAVAELDRQVERGSFFTQAVLQRGFSRIEQTETLLTRLVDLLAARGVVEPEELGFALARPPEEPNPTEEYDELPPAEPGESSVGWPTVAYEVPAAVKVAIDPASVIPSSIIWPSTASR